MGQASRQAQLGRAETDRGRSRTLSQDTVKVGKAGSYWLVGDGGAGVLGGRAGERQLRGAGGRVAAGVAAARCCSQLPCCG